MPCCYWNLFGLPQSNRAAGKEISKETTARAKRFIAGNTNERFNDSQ